MADFCINRKSDDYKELYNVFGNDQLIHLLWDRNGGHNLYLTPNGKVSKLFEQLMEFTDNNIVEALKLKAQYYLDEYTNINGKWYEDFKDEPSLSQLINYNDTSIGALTSFLDRLSKKVGYTWMYNPNLPKGTRGQVNTEDYDEPTIEINPYEATINTPIHEFAHIFLAAIQRDNKELYDNLVKELSINPISKSYIPRVEESYKGESKESKLAEVLVYTLQEYASDMIDKDTGLFSVISKVWDYIKTIICDAFGIAKSATINPNTTLSELAYLLVNPDVKLDLGKKLSNQDIMSLYQTGKLAERAKMKPSYQFTAEEIVNKFKEHAKNIIETEVEENGKKKPAYYWGSEISANKLEGVTSRMKKYTYGRLGEVGSS